MAVCPKDGTPLSGWRPPMTGEHDMVVGLKLGDYLVEERVAHGGMGIVYRAVQPMIGRRVAVKVLRPEMASNQQQVDRFLAEARAISAIRHRGIVDVISFGSLPDGRQYMIMEFLEGEALDMVIAREAPLNFQVALPIFDEILDALSAAHQAGVVHRDLKPSNVFLAQQTNRSRVVKLVDFGLAKQTPLGDPNARTGERASLIAGTPEYISPEQIRGEAATPRTDLYGFGVVAFEMLTKRLPFLGQTVVDTLEMHARTEAPHVKVFRGDVPPALDDLVYRLMAKKVADRPSSAEAVRQEIQRIMRELRIEATLQPREAPTSPSLPEIPGLTGIGPDLGPALPRRRRAWVAAGAAGLLALTGGAVALWPRPVEPEVVVLPTPQPPPPLVPPQPAPTPTPTPAVQQVDPPDAVVADPGPKNPRPPRQPAVRKRPFQDWDGLSDDAWRQKMGAWLDQDERKLKARTPKGEEPSKTAMLLLNKLRADVARKGRLDRRGLASAVDRWEREQLRK